MKTARVQLAPTRRTDLVCMSCGRFRTEFAVVPIGGDTTREANDSHVGVHRACLGTVHLRRNVIAPTHVKGCNTERRGCMPGCSNYDPKYDYQPGDPEPTHDTTT